MDLTLTENKKLNKALNWLIMSMNLAAVAVIFIAGTTCGSDMFKSCFYVGPDGTRYEGLPCNDVAALANRSSFMFDRNLDYMREDVAPDYSKLGSVVPDEVQICQVNFTCPPPPSCEVCPECICPECPESISEAMKKEALNLRPGSSGSAAYSGGYIDGRNDCLITLKLKETPKFSERPSVGGYGMWYSKKVESEGLICFSDVSNGEMSSFNLNLSSWALVGNEGLVEVRKR